MSWEKEEAKSRHVDFQCVKSKSITNLAHVDGVDGSTESVTSFSPTSSNPLTTDPPSLGAYDYILSVAANEETLVSNSGAVGTTNTFSNSPLGAAGGGFGIDTNPIEGSFHISLSSNSPDLNSSSNTESKFVNLKKNPKNDQI